MIGQTYRTDIWNMMAKRISDKENSMCKGPGAGKSLLYSRDRRKNNLVGI